jgi:hypothetical protein
MATLAQLVSELKTLRKGRGLLVSDIEVRVGPALREVCDVTSEDGPADIRNKVNNRLDELAGALPMDLRIAVLAAFAIAQEARLPLYQDRVGWAATKLGRDPRTVRRRVDEGIHQLAQLAQLGVTPQAAEDPAGPVASAAWHTRELRVTLALDRERPEAIEYRKIVADQDDVSVLDLAMTLTGPHGDPRPRGLGVDVFYGGTLVGRRMESSDRFAFDLALPKTLAKGETHDYALHFRVPEGQRMQPHFACVPKHPCDVFDLRIRFDQTRPLPRIWLLSNVFQRDVDDPLPGGEELVADEAGEVRLLFRNLTPGLAYGARWES